MKRVVATEDNVVVISGGTELDPHVKVYKDKAAYEKAPHNKDERVLTVPKGSYFVEGDNRSNSYDSRFWKDPFIRADEVEGNVLFQF